MTENTLKTSNDGECGNDSRRNFLRGTAVASGAALAAAAALPALADDFSAFDSDAALDGETRAEAAFRLRRRDARELRDQAFLLPDQLDNDDEARYAGQRYYASFSKTLPCNRFGEVRPAAFEQLVTAMRTGEQSDFNAIPLANPAQFRLANPQGALRFDLSGLDSHATRIRAAPTFRSAETAAEMGEVYWQAATRDVPFIDYNRDNRINAAVRDLNNFSEAVGPKRNGKVRKTTIFRGETPGDLVGPYISQFLLRDVPFGPTTIEQRYEVPVAGVDFLTDVDSWLSIQRGAFPTTNLAFDPERRYIYNGRSLGEYVHRDVSFQGYLNAALIMLTFGSDALDPDNPYRSTITNQGGFTSLGPPLILDLVTRAGNLGLSGSWFQKWRVHRRLRPEVYAARVHFHATGERNYELHPDILDSRIVDLAFQHNGTALLPCAFPEGSPTHPSYVAGHAGIAGACVTVLKAMFDEDFVLPDNVQANADGSSLLPFNRETLTAGGEFNKLANNIAIGRDTAGVHYRSDGIEGLELGEQQAIALLRGVSRTFNEPFAGFTFTTFGGNRIRIADGNVTPA